MDLSYEFLFSCSYLSLYYQWKGIRGHGKYNDPMVHYVYYSLFTNKTTIKEIKKVT